MGVIAGEAKQSRSWSGGMPPPAGDCFVATVLAMTVEGAGGLRVTMTARMVMMVLGG